MKKFPPDGHPYFPPPYERGENDDLEPAANLGPDLDRQPERVKPTPSNYRRMEKPNCG